MDLKEFKLRNDPYRVSIQGMETSVKILKNQNESAINTEGIRQKNRDDHKQ